MPPTDCFEDAGAGCTSMSCVPSTSVPECHGTDPDLSAPTPLPSGIAAAGLDLSPVMGPAQHGVSTKAKRKLRGSPARAGGAGGGPVSPMAARLSRGFPPSGIRPAIATPAAGGFVVPCSESSSVKMEEPDELPPALAPLRAAAVGSSGSAAAASARGGVDCSVKSEQEADGGQADGNVGACGDLREQDQLQLKKKPEVDIKEMVCKARKAAHNIRLLLHAKRCDGGHCREQGCESARQLVKHMRGCHLTRETQCKNAHCVQAKKMLRHYANCGRMRVVGGRYCLVCSFVARSATSNSNVMAAPVPSSSPGVPPLASSQQQQRRQPLGYLGPGAPPAGCGSSLQQQGSSKRAEKGEADVGVPSPVAISRCRRGGGFAQQQQQQQQRMAVPKDGNFFRPLPRMRRGSWGGYDRMRYLRRARFDSIPEEVPEEDCDCEEEDYDASETASDAGSKSTVGDGGSSAGSGTGDSRNKTLLTSISL
ncbi:unnamed protein product [Scytosiphon promiscuus]